MNKKLSAVFAMAGLACALSMPLMAATTTTTAPSNTSNGSSMSGPSSGTSSSDAKKAKHAANAKKHEPAGTNGAQKKGTALPGSGGEAGSGGNSAPQE